MTDDGVRDPGRLLTTLAHWDQGPAAADALHRWHHGEAGDERRWTDASIAGAG